MNALDMKQWLHFYSLSSLHNIRTALYFNIDQNKSRILTNVIRTVSQWSRGSKSVTVTNLLI